MEQIERLLILGVSSFVTYFLGGWSILLTALIILNALDYATGLTANWCKRSSYKAFRGGVKKGIMWMWVGVSNLIYLILIELNNLIRKVPVEINLIIINDQQSYY